MMERLGRSGTTKVIGRPLHGGPFLVSRTGDEG